MRIVEKSKKKCMEILGGRESFQGSYVMPRLEMEIQSQLAQNNLKGGGEVHYVSACASGRIHRVMLADICATRELFHNVSQTLRRNLIQKINSIWHNQIVKRTNQQLAKFAEQGCYASASLATFFAPTRTLSICNAGNPPPLMYRARTQQWSVLHGEPQPQKWQAAQGGTLNLSEYRHQKVRLSTGDIVLLMGNGFTQSALPCGGLANHQKFVELANQRTGDDPMDTAKEIIGHVCGNSQPCEDRTVIIFKVTSSRVPLLDSVLAPLRMLRGAADSTRLQSL